ncbi:hypothetical protein W02_22470 [Nitrospira sp. KM1]|nr:hypothetical protein W02_22470 [Nitrospira sp. KM1]
MYYHLSSVPKRLRGYLKGREEVWRSLRTDDKDEAKARSADWESRIQRLFLVLHKHGESRPEAEREALVSHRLETELDEAESHDQLEDAHEALILEKFMAENPRVERTAKPMKGESRSSWKPSAETYPRIPIRFAVLHQANNKVAIKRKVFSDDQLLTRLESKDFIQQRQERPERY